MPGKIDARLLDKIGKPRDIVDNLLNAQIEQVEKELGGKGIGNKILSMFVQNGNRVQLDPATIANQLDGKASEEKICTILDRLVEADLLRHAGENKYEIINNVVAQRAFQKTEGENLLLRRMESMVRNRIDRGIMLDEDDLAYIDNFLASLELTPEERAFVEESRANIKRKRRRLAAAIITAFILLASLATVTFISSQDARRSNRLYVRVNDDLKKSNTELQEKTADLEQARRIIELQRDSALIREAFAEQLRDDAQIAQRLEFEARIRAQISADSARVSAANAEVQTQLAKNAKASAEAAAKEAMQRQLEAEIARSLAKSAQAEAEAYSEIYISHNASNRSLQEEDPRLRALIALHAYQINYKLPEYGDVFHPSIMKALYTAAKELDEDLDYNISNAHRGNIRDIIAHPTKDIFYTTGSDGMVNEWRITDWNRVGKPKLERTNFSVERGAVNNQLALSESAYNMLVIGELPIVQVLSTEFGQTTNFFPTLINAELFGGGFLGDDQSFIVYGVDTAFVYQHPSPILVPYKKLSSKVNALYEVNDSVFGFSFRGSSSSSGYSLDIQRYFDGRFTQDEWFFRQESYGTISAAAITQAESSEYLALGLEDGVVLIFDWDPRTVSSAESGKRYVFKEHVAAISDIAFSNSGKFLSVASYDGTVTVWQIDRLDDPSYLPIVFDIHDGWAMSLAFSNDDRFLLVGDRNGSLTFWSLKPSDYANLICEELRNQYRNLLEMQIDEVEWERLFGSNIEQINLCQ